MGVNQTYDDFDGSLADLGGNGESLEEGSLLRTEPSVLSGNDDTTWGNGSITGGRTDLVLQQLVSHLHQVTTGEHEPHISLDVRQDPVRN